MSPSSYSRSSRPRRRFSSRSSLVGELGLRVAVEPLHPAVRRRPVEGPPVLLGVLAVVALAVGEPEQALLEDGVLPVPQRDPEVEEAEAVADGRRGRPRPSGRRGRGPGRRGRRSRRRRRRSSPPGPCPTAGRTRRAPTGAMDRPHPVTPPCARARRCGARGPVLATRWPRSPPQSPNRSPGGDPGVSPNRFPLSRNEVRQTAVRDLPPRRSAVYCSSCRHEQRGGHEERQAPRGLDRLLSDADVLILVGLWVGLVWG